MGIASSPESRFIHIRCLHWNLQHSNSNVNLKPTFCWRSGCNTQTASNVYNKWRNSNFLHCDWSEIVIIFPFIYSCMNTCGTRILTVTWKLNRKKTNIFISLSIPSSRKQLSWRKPSRCVCVEETMTTSSRMRSIPWTMVTTFDYLSLWIRLLRRRTSSEIALCT